MFGRKYYKENDPRYLVAVALLRKAKTSKQKNVLRKMLKEHQGFDFLAHRQKIKAEINSKSSGGKIIVHTWSGQDALHGNPDTHELSANLVSYLMFARTARGKSIIINNPSLTLRQTIPTELKLRSIL